MILLICSAHFCVTFCLAARLSSTAEATTSLLRIGAIVPNRRNASSARPMVQAAANGSVAVALIDTGCDVTNEDLNIVGGMDFTSDNSYGLDGNGHGTHVAGEGDSSSSSRSNSDNS
jgi:subtilisin family serine protease